MSSHAIQDAQNSLVKAEPVIATHIAAAVLGYVGTLLVAHGVLTGGQASALTQQVLPAVVAGLLVMLGVIVRRFVAPAALFAQRVEEEVQRRLEALAAGQAQQAPAAHQAPTVLAGTAPVVPADAGADVLARAEAIHPMPRAAEPARVTEAPA